MYGIKSIESILGTSYKLTGDAEEIKFDSFMPIEDASESSLAWLSPEKPNKFEVLEAEAQLARDKQLLNEKNIQHKINKLSLREILNIKGDFDVKQDQSFGNIYIKLKNNGQ